MVRFQQSDNLQGFDMVKIESKPENPISRQASLRVFYGTENRWPRKGPAGSNPAASAIETYMDGSRI